MPRPRAVVIAAFLLAASCPPAVACDLSPPETGTVAAVLDGETLKLTDHAAARLAGRRSLAIGR